MDMGYWKRIIEKHVEGMLIMYTNFRKENIEIFISSKLVGPIFLYDKISNPNHIQSKGVWYLPVGIDTREVSKMIKAFDIWKKKQCNFKVTVY